MVEEERVQKVLAARGIASRRRADELITAGRVKVNGEVARVGQRVSPLDDIEVDGKSIPPTSASRYLALNKPLGIVSTLRSTHGERNVTELVPLGERVFPVGRLDKETGGLLFLTNAGDWANLVTHPRYQVEKEYLLVVRGTLHVDDIEQLRVGIVLPDGTLTASARVEPLSHEGRNSRLSVTVIEGKKRQLRLMAAAIGHPAVSLQRIRIGSVRLGSLPVGQWRHLDAREVESIRAHADKRTGGSSPPTEIPDRHRRSGRFR